MGFYQQVNPGDPVSSSARFQNDLRRKLGELGNFKPKPAGEYSVQPGIVLGYNAATGGVTFKAGQPVKIGTGVLSGDAVPFVSISENNLDGGYGVLMEDLPVNGYARAVVSGCAETVLPSSSARCVAPKVLSSAVSTDWWNTAESGARVLRCGEDFSGIVLVGGNATETTADHPFRVTLIPGEESESASGSASGGGAKVHIAPGRVFVYGDVNDTFYISEKTLDVPVTQTYKICLLVSMFNISRSIVFAGLDFAYPDISTGFAVYEIAQVERGIVYQTLRSDVFMHYRSNYLHFHVEPYFDLPGEGTFISKLLPKEIHVNGGPCFVVDSSAEQGFLIADAVGDYFDFTGERMQIGVRHGEGGLFGQDAEIVVNDSHATLIASVSEDGVIDQIAEGGLLAVSYQGGGGSSSSGGGSSSSGGGESSSSSGGGSSSSGGGESSSSSGGFWPLEQDKFYVVEHWNYEGDFGDEPVWIPAHGLAFPGYLSHSGQDLTEYWQWDGVSLDVYVRYFNYAGKFPMVGWLKLVSHVFAGPFDTQLEANQWIQAHIN